MDDIGYVDAVGKIFEGRCRYADVEFSYFAVKRFCIGMFIRRLKRAKEGDKISLLLVNKDLTMLWECNAFRFRYVGNRDPSENNVILLEGEITYVDSDVKHIYVMGIELMIIPVNCGDGYRFAFLVFNHSDRKILLMGKAVSKGYVKIHGV